MAQNPQLPSTLTPTIMSMYFIFGKGGEDGALQIRAPLASIFFGL